MSENKSEIYRSPIKDGVLRVFKTDKYHTIEIISNTKIYRSGEVSLSTEPDFHKLVHLSYINEYFCSLLRSNKYNIEYLDNSYCFEMADTIQNVPVRFICYCFPVNENINVFSEILNLNDKIDEVKNSVTEHHPKKIAYAEISIQTTLEFAKQDPYCIFKYKEAIQNIDYSNVKNMSVVQAKIKDANHRYMAAIYHMNNSMNLTGDLQYLKNSHEWIHTNYYLRYHDLVGLVNEEKLLNELIENPLVNELCSIERKGSNLMITGVHRLGKDYSKSICLQTDFAAVQSFLNLLSYANYDVLWNNGVIEYFTKDETRREYCIHKYELDTFTYNHKRVCYCEHCVDTGGSLGKMWYSYVGKN
jgi:hypothetical protein